ncbi:MAG TPA: CsbD family protein [Rudaea sp.]|nr:CsbD family protein [Rudaea sp.]
MVQDMIRTKWSLLGARLRLKWSKLTEDDVGRREGHRDYLVSKLQERYGIAKEKARVEVKEFERSLR